MAMPVSYTHLDLGLYGVENLEDLRLVGLGIAVDLFAAKRLARDVAAGGVADQCSRIADEEDDGMSQRLEMTQFSDEDGVAQMQVRRGGIESGLDAHGHARRARLRDAFPKRLQRNRCV